MNIHFIGIGGIGVSALAKYYLQKGSNVTGSDGVESEITKALEKLGAVIDIGEQKSENLPADTNLVIYSPAVQETNPELKAAKDREVQTFSYPEALGELTKEYYTIAVSGTHGKSTTTAMIGLLLLKAGLDPTVIVGTKVKEFDSSVSGSNCRVGKSKYLVIEADEHFASFLNYSPDIIVLTNIEADHLDYYKTLENILETFKKYILNLKDGGVLVANQDDGNIQKILENCKFQIANFRYSPKQKDTQDLQKLMKIPGQHSVSNALAALAVARYLDIPDEKSFSALSEFQGSWRRFEIFDLKTPVSYTLVSDYGHHPTEITATIQGAREKWPDKEIWLVFQPHQYQRTFHLFDDFTSQLAALPIQRLIIPDIYDVPGREGDEFRQKVSSEKLIKAIQKLVISNQQSVIYLPSLTEVQDYLRKNLRGEEIVIIMGAGDIYDLTVNLTHGD